MTRVKAQNYTPNIADVPHTLQNIIFSAEEIKGGDHLLKF